MTSHELHKRITRLDEYLRFRNISHNVLKRRLVKFNESLNYKLFLDKVEKIKKDKQCGDFEALFDAHYGDRVRAMSNNNSVLLKKIRR